MEGKVIMGIPVKKERIQIPLSDNLGETTQALKVIIIKRIGCTRYPDQFCTLGCTTFCKREQ